MFSPYTKHLDKLFCVFMPILYLCMFQDTSIIELKKHLDNTKALHRDQVQVNYLLSHLGYLYIYIYFYDLTLLIIPRMLL